MIPISPVNVHRVKLKDTNLRRSSGTFGLLAVVGTSTGGM